MPGTELVDLSTLETEDTNDLVKESKRASFVESSPRPVEIRYKALGQNSRSLQQEQLGK